MEMELQFNTSLYLHWLFRYLQLKKEGKESILLALTNCNNYAKKLIALGYMNLTEHKKFKKMSI